MIELEQKLQDQTNKVIFRSRAKWYEEGEKNTKYFYSLEKANYNAKTCNALLVNGEIIDDDESILQQQSAYYEDLYKEDPSVNFEASIESPVKLSEDQKNSLNGPVTMDKIKKAVFSLKKNKTPGQDGLSTEVYTTFWPLICQHLYETIDYAFEHNKLHETALQGILNVIPKPGKDSRIIGNLRPITLLNTDYKIIEKIVLNRILNVLDLLVHPDQRGFMQGRSISVNVRKLLDIHDILVRDQKDAVVLSLDFSKAFDKVSFSAIRGSLEYFNFPEFIIRWTSILSTNFQIRVQNNGKFSRYFQVSRGIHQGGVCSAAYFVLAAETMAQKIRKNSQISGVFVRSIENKLNQFADDTDAFSSNTKDSVQALVNELQDFRHQSGLEINYNKTTLYRIGSLKKSNAHYYMQPRIEWAEESIQVLGITITREPISLIDRNYQILVEKTASVLNNWCNRSLSLFGKVNIVNTLVASLFIYKMKVLPCIPESFLNKINSLILEVFVEWEKGKNCLSHAPALKKARRSQSGLYF